MFVPLVSLIVVGFGLAVSIYMFWPDKGAFWKWRRGLQSTERVLIEDALKHLHDQEYKGLPSTLLTVSGALSIPGDQAAKLMERLESLSLVESRRGGFELTSMGRSYALRMIRIHRLWETYLADKTGVSDVEWHNKAEELEHGMTEEEIKELAASVGHPTYDPDGDPIPTANGELPPMKGQPLTDLAPNQLARIIHIEDEPSAVYAQLMAVGLRPGMKIRILEKGSKRSSFIADKKEVVLAPVVAANISVVPLEEPQREEDSYCTLGALEIGGSGEVIGISTVCRRQQRRRLMDLGVIPGTVITTEIRSASGEPVAYNIRGATIALRKCQAEFIHIKSE
jgi:DtxR family Mn-dependent transcriptional regulator